MAIIRTSAMIADISGGIGGQVYARTRSGLVVRSKQRPSDIVSVATSRVRGQLSQLSQQWRGLTSAQRSQWETYAAGTIRSSRRNPSYQLSGFDCYVQVNSGLLQASMSRVLVPPGLHAPQLITLAVPSCNLAGSDLRTQITSPAISGASYVYYCTRPISDGITNWKSETMFRFVVGTANTSTNRFTAIQNVVGNLSTERIGQTMGLRVRPILSDGYQYQDVYLLFTLT